LPEKDRGSDAGQAEAARAAAGEAARAADAAGRVRRGRPSDVFGGELRRRDMFTLLVLHLITRSESGASYGNQLIEQIEALTSGAVSLNPNTMYPLLRELEGGGFIEGRWEHPEKRSRRMYKLTESGHEEYERLRSALEPFLDEIVHSITLIKQEVYGTGR
jgi:PadR family transcriptional regulator PadR